MGCSSRSDQYVCWSQSRRSSRFHPGSRGCFPASDLCARCLRSEKNPTFGVDVLKSFEQLKDAQFDLLFRKVLALFGLFLNHIFKIIRHELEHNVLNQFILLIPAIEEVLIGKNAAQKLKTSSRKVAGRICKTQQKLLFYFPSKKKICFSRFFDQSLNLTSIFITWMQFLISVRISYSLLSCLPTFSIRLRATLRLLLTSNASKT